MRARETMVRLLLASGANIDHVAADSTALLRVCQAGDVSLARLLLDHGASVNYCDNGANQTALHYACEFGHHLGWQTHGRAFMINDIKQMKSITMFY